MLFNYNDTEVTLVCSLIDALHAIHCGNTVLGAWDALASIDPDESSEDVLLDATFTDRMLIGYTASETITVTPCFGLCSNVYQTLLRTDVATIFTLFKGYSGLATFPLGVDEYDSPESRNKFNNPDRKALLEHSLDVLNAFVKAYKEQYYD